MAKALRKTYVLKITLMGAKPPIWCRFRIDSTVPLPKLHEVIQIIMGWMDCHLHQFIAAGCFYGVPDPEFGFEEVLDEKKYRLNQLLKKEKDSIIYEYDFGDGWEHKIVLEKIAPFDTQEMLPLCIKARGACPPEDVGGIWGYYEFLEALKNNEHPEHEEYKEWIGGDFEPGAYDIGEVNELLTVHCQ